eukprot:ctg_9.g4
MQCAGGGGVGHGGGGAGGAHFPPGIRAAGARVAGDTPADRRCGSVGAGAVPARGRSVSGVLAAAASARWVSGQVATTDARTIGTAVGESYGFASLGGGGGGAVPAPPRHRSQVRGGVAHGRQAADGSVSHGNLGRGDIDGRADWRRGCRYRCRRSVIGYGVWGPYCDGNISLARDAAPSAGGVARSRHDGADRVSGAAIAAGGGAAVFEMAGHRFGVGVRAGGVCGGVGHGGGGLFGTAAGRGAGRGHERGRRAR